MPWWTMIPRESGPEYAKHRTLIDAGIDLRFATSMGGVRAEDCGLYRRDP